MATCNVNTLLVSGKDFQRLSKRELQIAIAQLLCEILNGGGAGAAGAVYIGTTAARDATVPTVVAPAGAIWILTDTVPAGQISWWDGAAWN